MNKDKFWMVKALEQANVAAQKGEVPVGAILISADDTLLSSAHNEVITQNDPTAHAEICAIRNASKLIDNYRLNHTTLYITLEPCAMCAGAIIHARIERIVYATRDVTAGAAGSVYNLMGGGILNHAVQVDEGILQKESADLLSSFFRERRTGPTRK